MNRDEGDYPYRKHGYPHLLTFSLGPQCPWSSSGLPSWPSSLPCFSPLHSYHSTSTSSVQIPPAPGAGTKTKGGGGGGKEGREGKYF